MRCPECDYPLWNLAGRQCPECGAPFDVSAHRFVPNRVGFHCPACDQIYYGTGAGGHLEPPEFDCVRCGRHLGPRDMVLRPAPGVSEAATRPERMPWLERDTGAVRAWLATIGLALIRPGALMAAVPPGSGLAPAWRFAILTNLATVAASLVPALCIFLPALALPALGSRPGGGLGPAALLGLAGGGILLALVASLVFLALTLALWPPVCHGLLRATGPTAGGLRRTTQAICYSSGANASSAVPCIGDFGGIWWVVSAILMVREGQKVGGWRASLAVLAFPIVLLVLVVGLYAGLLFTTLGPPSGGRASLGGAGRAETLNLVRRLRDYAEAHGDRGPAHALVLVPATGMGAGSFVSSTCTTSFEQVPVAGTTLAALRESGPNRQRMAAERAAGGLPEGVVAYRLGDFVLCDVDVDYAHDPAGLWIVLLAPEPGALCRPEAPPELVAGRLDGTVERVPAGQLPDRLRRQNALRERRGLAPLPDPTSITHERPGRGREGD